MLSGSAERGPSQTDCGQGGGGPSSSGALLEILGRDRDLSEQPSRGRKPGRDTEFCDKV